MKKRGALVLFAIAMAGPLWGRPFPETLFRYEEQTGLVPDALRRWTQCDIHPSVITLERDDANQRRSLTHPIRFTASVPTLADLQRLRKNALLGPIDKGVAMTDGGLIRYTIISGIDGHGQPTFLALRSRGEEALDNRSDATPALVEFIDANCK